MNIHSLCFSKVLFTAALATLVVARAGASGVIVYDNTSGPGIFTAAGEVGDTVTLAGTDRTVTQISIGVVGNGGSPDAGDSFQMRFWTADGPGGTLGTLLWQSSSINIPVAGPLQLITFNVPDVLVPDTFIFDVSHTDSGSVFFEWSNPVTVGSSPDFAWAYGTQVVDGYFGTPANFMAQIQAVPEPSCLTFALGGLVLFAARRRIFPTTSAKV